MFPIFLLFAAVQASDYAALDTAHESWLRCAVSEAERLASSADAERVIIDRAYAHCGRESQAVRAAISRLHPGSPRATIDDVLSQFRERGSVLVQAAVRNSRQR